MSEIRCCVLGATGFIGGQIARAAAAQGWQVCGLRRRPDAVGAIGDLGIEWASGDLTDLASLVTAMRGCPLVFHAAGYYPHRARDVRETVEEDQERPRREDHERRRAEPVRLDLDGLDRDLVVPGSLHHGLTSQRC